MRARIVNLDASPEAAAPDWVGPPECVIGLAHGPLTLAGRRVARTLTASFGPTDDGVEVIGAADPDAAADDLIESIVATADPALVCAQVLRAVEHLDAFDGLAVESLAYSTLLGGHTFKAWRASRPLGDQTPSVDAVRVRRRADVLYVVLDRPGRRNALDATARGALSDALDIALADRSLNVELSGEGPSFCSGGDLDEFGTATDLALAHVLRIQRGPAPRMLALRGRTTARVHGACVGAGVELAAFAERVVATPETTFRLPELSMGLIPGAGGTVSVSQRIGRWRAAWWMLSGETLDVERAIAWGLVDGVA
jgi:hypothetical protein